MANPYVFNSDDAKKETLRVAQALQQEKREKEEQEKREKEEQEKREKEEQEKKNLETRRKLCEYVREIDRIVKECNALSVAAGIDCKLEFRVGVAQ